MTETEERVGRRKEGEKVEAGASQGGIGARIMCVVLWREKFFTRLEREKTFELIHLCCSRNYKFHNFPLDTIFRLNMPHS